VATITSLCLFCGSRPGNDPAYAEAARAFGRMLGEKRIRLVYGGGQVGLMGITADAALEAGGEVIGIIPRQLHQREVQHPRLTRLEVVPDMHSRKRMMFELSDAFVVLPGGIGTLDELCEVMSWQTLELHHKPVVLYDVAGYWKPFVALMDRVVQAGFAWNDLARDFALARSPEDVLTILAAAPEPRASYPDRF